MTVAISQTSQVTSRHQWSPYFHHNLTTRSGLTSPPMFPESATFEGGRGNCLSSGTFLTDTQQKWHKGQEWQEILPNYCNPRTLQLCTPCIMQVVAEIENKEVDMISIMKYATVCKLQRFKFSQLLFSYMEASYEIYENFLLYNIYTYNYIYIHIYTLLEKCTLNSQEHTLLQALIEHMKSSSLCSNAWMLGVHVTTASSTLLIYSCSHLPANQSCCNI